MKELQDIIREFQRNSANNAPMALATLVRARGSSYRRPGARMLITHGGRTVGAMSGGCVEEEIAERARETVMRTGDPQLMTLDTRARFGCNGAIEVFIEPLEAGDEFLSAAAIGLRERRSFLAATFFETTGVVKSGTRVLRDAAEFPQLAADVAKAQRFNFAVFGSYDFFHGTASALIQAIQPPVRLVVAGEGPDNNALAAFARVLGWEFVEVKHPAEIRCDDRTAILVKTHNYGRDFTFLQAVLSLAPRYLGLVGPKKRRDQILAELIDASAGPVELKSLHGPAGLDLGAESPEEIALAIIAEIQAVFAEGSGKPLRDHRGAIHARTIADASLGQSALRS